MMSWMEEVEGDVHWGEVLCLSGKESDCMYRFMQLWCQSLHFLWSLLPVSLAV